MTTGGAPPSAASSSGAPAEGQFEDSGRPPMPSASVPAMPMEDGRGDRDRSDRGDRERGRGEESSGRGRRDRSVSRDRSLEARYVWKKKERRISSFDVRPPPGVELPPIAVAAGVGQSNAHKSFDAQVAATTYGGAGMGGGMGLGIYGAPPPAPRVDPQLQLTRHARRVYAGGIPAGVSEAELMLFFTDVIVRASGMRWDSPPVLKIYLNAERAYAFIEFCSMELCAGCMELDGIKFEHHSGPATIRIRRPNDFRPELVPSSCPPAIKLNLSSMGIQSAAASNASKIFIGGLPYNLTDEQVMELLGAFGPIKSFHQVRDPGAANTKGYGFCEYADTQHAEAAIAGLHSMPLGEKTLTVRWSTSTASGSGGGGGGVSAMQQQMMQGMSGMGPGIGMGMGMAPLPPTPAPVPTTVLRLGNMVTREEIHDEGEFADIKEDVRLECSQYGPVREVVIPRAQDGFPAAAEGLIFVQFESPSGAAAAANVLNGRKFADKVVVVQFVSHCVFPRFPPPLTPLLSFNPSLLPSLLFPVSSFVTAFPLLQFNENEFAAKRLA